MRFIFSIAMLVVLAACSSGGGTTHTRRAAPDPTTAAFSQYIIVGDSLMDWSSGGDELTTTASLILLEENRSVVNISLAGQTMAGIDGRGGAEKDGVSGAINYLTAHGNYTGNPNFSSAVIIELAHNDWWVATSAEDFFSSYVRFLQAIATSDQVSIFCVVPVAAKWDYEGFKNPNGETYEELRNVVRKVSRTGLCKLVETSGWFTQENVYDRTIMWDGLHLSAGGHRIYKDRLIQALDKY